MHLFKIKTIYFNISRQLYLLLLSILILNKIKKRFLSVQFRMKKQKKSSFKNHKGFGVKILKMLRFIDLFGKDITLSYDGHDKYKSS